MTQQTPPPYLGIDGLYVQTDKHVDTTLAEYNGNARPGQLVVDTANYALYVSDASGQLTAIGGGGSGGYGNANVAAYLPTNIVDVGAANVIATGNVISTGNITNSTGVASSIPSEGWTGDGTNVIYSYSGSVLPPPTWVVGLPLVASGFSDIRVNGSFIVSSIGPGDTVTVTNPVNGSGNGLFSTIAQYPVSGNISTSGTITGNSLVTYGNATIGGSLNTSGYGVTAAFVKTIPVTVASLPTAGSTFRGVRSFVTNATTTTFASIVAGGGTNPVPVYCDGTNWRIG